MVTAGSILGAVAVEEEASMKKRRIVALGLCASVLLFTSCTNATGPDTTYTVTYDGNGNTGGSAPFDGNNYTEGHVVTVLGNVGYLTNIDGVSTAFGFDGWNTTKDGDGTHYAAGSTFAMGPSNVVLYAQWKPFAIRDTGPAGGLVFYDKGDYLDGWRYLEAAPASTAWAGASWAPWGSHGEFVSGAAGTAVGAGRQNTLSIIDHFGPGSDLAAQLCDGLSHAGCEDWWLPSRDELELMYQRLHAHGLGSFPVMYYWSSSQVDASNAWEVVFDDGKLIESQKLHGNSVRAVRAF